MAVDPIHKSNWGVRSQPCARVAALVTDVIFGPPRPPAWISFYDRLTPLSSAVAADNYLLTPFRSHRF